MIDHDRARGALLGLAIGDSFGCTREFSPADRGAFVPMRRGPQTQIVGGGRFGLAAGQCTDDTHMAVCIAESIGACSGQFDPEDVARRYCRWRALSFDVGALTGAALARLAAVGPGASGRAAWEASGRHAAGNGSLMRTASIAVAFAADEDRRRSATIADSAITHFDPRCMLACVAYNAAIARAVTAPLDSGEIPDVDSMAWAALTDLHAAVPMLLERYPDLGPLIDSARRDILEDLDAARRVEPFAGAEFRIDGGFVRTALRLAFATLAHARSFEEGIVHVVALGGDTDTNGAIAGALLGARFGERGIPRRWVDTVLGALAERPTSPFWTDYHPRLLLRLVP